MFSEDYSNLTELVRRAAFLEKDEALEMKKILKKIKIMREKEVA